MTLVINCLFLTKTKDFFQKMQTDHDRNIDPQHKSNFKTIFLMDIENKFQKLWYHEKALEKTKLDLA